METTETYRVGRTLPIKLDSISNSEYASVPVSRTVVRANMLAAARMTANARRTGQSRGRFLVSLCGAATTLLTLNGCFAGRREQSDAFELPREAAFEPEAAAQAIGGREFIFDIQTS